MRLLKIEYLKPCKEVLFYDCDMVMFHACFQMLVNFVEKEFVCSSVCWKPKEKKEILYLYDWYIWTFIFGSKSLIEYEDEGQKHLKRLINIRPTFWT